MQWEKKRSDILNVIKVAIDIPFYKETLKSVDTDLLTMEQFKDLPILYKKHIVGSEKMLLHPKYTEDSVYYEYTSGSTGNPLKCYKGIRERYIKTKDLWKFRKAYGNIRPQDKYTMFYAFAEDDLSTDLINEKENVLYLSMFDMSEEVLEMYYRKLIDYQAKWFFSVPSALYIFSQFIKSKGYDPKVDLNLRYIELSGEVLFDDQRKLIEEVFQMPVYNHYGSREFWCLAMSCEYGHLHTLDNRFYFEIINERADGTGELVVTDLFNKQWPLIRYYLGDIVSFSSDICECGQRIFDVTGGRSQEYLHIEDWIANPILFHYMVMKINRQFGDVIRQFQVVQQLEKSFVINIVPGIEMSNNILGLFKTELIDRIPFRIDISFEILEFIKFQGSKFKYFIPYEKEKVKWTTYINKSEK